MSPRFFLPAVLDCGNTVSLPAALVHHLRVLRLKEGDAITLFNGLGGEFQARLSMLTKGTAAAEILEFSPRECELPFELILVQAIAGGNKMDWLIEKAVELGASAIQPVQTQRCVVRLHGERAQKRLDHWQALVRSACEQCGRNRVPEVYPVLELAQMLEQHRERRVLAPPDVGDAEINLLLSPRAEASFSHIVSKNPIGSHRALSTVTLIVGPEGGLTDEEEIHAERSGFYPAHLGQRILRCETAGLAAMAALAMGLGGF